MEDIQLFLYEIRKEILKKDSNFSVYLIFKAIFTIIGGIFIPFIIYRLFVFYGVLLFSIDSNTIIFQLLLLIISIIICPLAFSLSDKIEKIEWKSDKYQIIEAKNNVKINETGITYNNKHYIYPDLWNITTSFPNITSIESECDYPVLRYKTKLNNKVSWIEIELTKEEYEKLYRKKINRDFLEELQGSVISDSYIVNQIYEEIKNTQPEKLKQSLYIFSGISGVLFLHSVIFAILRFIFIRDLDNIIKILLICIPIFFVLSVLLISAATNFSKLNSKYYSILYKPIVKRYNAKINKTSIIYSDIYYILPEFWNVYMESEEYMISYKLDIGKTIQTVILRISKEQYDRLRDKQMKDYLLKINDVI